MRCLIFLLLSITMVLCGHLPKKYTLDSYLGNPLVKNFIEYVRINTSQEENLPVAVDFWRRKALELDLDFKVYYPAGLPICVLSWYGTNASLPSIMLNSHMDVIMVVEEEWTYPPFSARMDENGDIYGRGTQDDKDVAIMYLEAIRTMKQDGVRLNRTLHMTLMPEVKGSISIPVESPKYGATRTECACKKRIVCNSRYHKPDEESGGNRGMAKFIDTEEFKNLNIGFVLDEGMITADDRLVAIHQDKRAWQMMITTRGKSGHSSSVSDSSAMEKFKTILNEISVYRDEQNAIMRSKDALDYGAYDSVNVNVVHGGAVPNVVPAKVQFVVDIRLAVSANITDISNRVSSWIEKAGNDTSIEYIRKILVSESTKVDDSNPYWVTMRNAVQELGIKIQAVICPATTDMFSLRNQGIPALGFAFKPRTKARQHAANEYLNVDNLLQGVNVYVKILSRLGAMGDVHYIQ